jgi:uncharacterized membrane protein YccF (DUF307 family)
MANPYDSHPIYSLRQCLLFLALVSSILGAFATASTKWDAIVWGFHLLWTFASASWCIYDLVPYALEQARNPEKKPTWPSRKIIVGDVVLLVLFGWWYSLELRGILMQYSLDVVEAYTSLMCLCHL